MVSFILGVVPDNLRPLKSDKREQFKRHINVISKLEEVSVLKGGQMYNLSCEKRVLFARELKLKTMHLYKQMRFRASRK